MAASPKRMSVESISSIDYMADVVKFAENLVNNLDGEALIELFGGSEKDINEIFTDLIQEIDGVLNFNERARSTSYQTLDTFSKQVEDQLRCDNFAYFVSSVLHNFVINWHHLEIMNMVQLYQKICVIASRGSGKTQIFSVLVQMADGTSKKICEVQPGDKIISLNKEWKNQIETVELTQYCGKKSTAKLKLKSGRSTEAAYTHPFRTLESWVPLSELKIGDRIATPRVIDIDNEEYDIKDEELCILGHIIANGSCCTSESNNFNSFSIWSLQYKDIVRSLLEKLNWKFTEEVSKKGYKFSIKQQKSFLHTHNLFGKLSLEKTIPDFIFKCSNRQIKLFLSHLWVDGSLCFTKSSKTLNGHLIDIQYSSASEKLIEQIQTLLLRIGIISMMKKKTMRYVKKDGSLAQAWYVNVYSRDNQLRFVQEIGDVLVRDKKEEFLHHLNSIDNNSNTDTIPKEYRSLMKMSANFHMQTLKVGFWNYSVNRDKLLRIANNEKNQELVNLATSDVYWDEIIEIEDKGEQDCYDLQISNTQNYIADNIYSHNSYLASYAYPLWKLYKYKQSTALIQQPYDITLCEFGMLFTHEMSLAEELLLNLKQGIEGNEILYEKLYNDKGDNWSKRSITCRNGARLQTKSYTSSARGRHPGYVVVDDYLIDNVISSTDFNANINNKFYSVIDNLPLKGGSVFVVGTPFSTVDLYSTFKKPESKYKVFEYPAIFPDGTLLWPEFYPMDVIEEKKKTQGNIVFSREILCKPITSDSTIFPYHILERNFSPLYTLINNIYSAPVRFQKVVMGCDFAISANIGADFSVFCTLGVDDKNRFWLLNLWRAQGKSYQEQIAQIKYLYQNFKHDVIFLEDNAMQKIFVEGTKASMLGMPIKGHTTTKIKNDLQKGWPSLAILFENERFVLPRGDQSSIDQIDLVCAEFNSVTFAGGKLASATQHDDIVSAIWIAVQGALYKDDSLRLHF